MPKSQKKQIKSIPAKKQVKQTDKQAVAQKSKKNSVKPVKQAVKIAVKKEEKHQEKNQSKIEKPLVKTLVKAVGKLLGKDKDKSIIPVKEAKKSKEPKKKAKKIESDEIDLGDDLIGDEDLGSEDIPDLAEFVETESEIEIEIADESVELMTSKPTGDEEIILTDAEGRRYCRVRECDQVSVVEGYCRFHYLLLWKKIQVRRKILTDGKLERYVEELTSRYPDKFLEMIRRDLRSEKDFLTAIAELEIDESAVDNEFEDEAQSYVDEIRGMSETSSSISDEEEF